MRRFPHELTHPSSPRRLLYAGQGTAGRGRNHKVLTTDQIRAIGQSRRAAEEMLEQRLLEARRNELSNASASAEGETEPAGPGH